MFRNYFISLFLLLSNLSFSQYLKGRVVDVSNQPLPGATVYYDGTTLSSLTNDNGEFLLVYDPKLNRPLTVSYIGYQTVYLQSYSADQPLLIVMDVAVNKLREIIIKKSKFSRKEMMAIFKERFLGTTSFGKKMIIQNEADIEFEYDEEKFILKAYSEKPLILINPSLGYKITYELVDFETIFSHLTINPHQILKSYYAGLSHYEEIDKRSKIIKQREKAYKGSIVHFFRNLVNGVWGENDFQLFEKGYMVNPKDHFAVTFEEDKYKVIIQKQEFKLKRTDGVLAIFSLRYDKKEQSQVQFSAETIYVDPFGNNISLREVSFSGAMSLKRVGDMLPLNYGM